MVVFSGSLSLLSYALGGTLNVVYGAIYGVTAFVAAAVGATVIGHIVRRTGKVGPEPVVWSSSVLRACAWQVSGLPAISCFRGKALKASTGACMPVANDRCTTLSVLCCQANCVI